MKHIALFVTSFNVGGVERAFVNLANSFVNNGYKVDLIVCRNIGDLKSELDPRISLIDFKDSRLRECFFQLYKYIRNTSASHIITGPTYPNLVALVANMVAFNKIRVIISQHGYQDIEMEGLGVLGKIAPFLIKRIYNYAFRIVCVSHGVANYLVSEYGISPDKVAVIYNAVLDDDFYRKAQEEIKVKAEYQEILRGNYLVAVGRLAGVKNYPFMLKAFSSFRKFHPDYRLIILGDGAERDHLQNEIARLSLQQHVILLGSLTNPLSVMKRARLLIHTSLSESMGLIYVEALALKVPVVTVTNSGSEEILKGITPKKIVDSFDEEKFVSAIRGMLETKFADSDFPSLDDFRCEKIRCQFLNIIE